MTSRLALHTFDSFCAADEATRREYWLMSMEQRLEILEQLRMQAYPDGQTAPRLQRVLESVEMNHSDKECGQGCDIGSCVIHYDKGK